MYIIKADGKMLYSPELIDDAYKVITPMMHLEINAAGSLDFTLPPCNALYDEVLKMKSIITVEQDGEVVFRGRITEETVDTYKQRRIYCEGDLAFLLDSLQGPFEFTGTQRELFSQLITAHNAQMDVDKQFVLGNMSGLDNETVISIKVDIYADTFSVVQTYLIDLSDGYIQTRTRGGTHYIDFVDGNTDECTQVIEFGVNMLNFESQMNAKETCTVFVPLGAMQEDGSALTIASVNDGKVYIENPEAIALYGRIWKTYTWEGVTDQAELLRLGNEYLSDTALPETLSITAVDMHLLDADVEKIKKGCMVHLRSKPHGIDKKIMCASIDADFENPDQTVYGLGLPKQRLNTIAELTAYAEANAEKAKNDAGHTHRWLKETETSLNVAIEHLDLIGHRVNNVELDVDAAQAEIAMRAYKTEVDVLGERVAGAEVAIDGLNAEIKLVAAQKSIEELVTRITAAEVEIDGLDAKIKLFATESSIEALVERVTAAEVSIDGAKAQIDLKASQSTVDELGQRVSAAELLIDGQNSKIAAKADLILLDGYVKASDLEAEVLTILEFAWANEIDVQSLVAGSVNTNYLSADSITTDSLSVGGQSVATSSHSHSLTVGSDGTITLGEVSSSGGSFNIADTAYYKNGVSAARTEGANGVNLTNMGWQGGASVIKASNGKSLTVNLPTFIVSGGDSFNSSNKTTVYFSTSSVNGYLKSKDVDATPVYNSGYENGYSNGETSGYNVGYAQARPASVSRTAGYDAANNVYNVSVVVTSNDGTTRTFALPAISASEATNAAYNSGYDVGYKQGYQAAKDAVKVTAGISWSNPAQNYCMIRYWGKATIDGVEVGYASSSESRNISGYV